MTELQVLPPYFFLVDLMLPEINGYEFARLIRSDEKLKNVKVVLLSSAFDPVDDAEYQACGADAVIAKPFDPSELRDVLHRLQGLPPSAPPADEDADPLDPSLLLETEAPAGGGDPNSILSSLLDKPADEAREATVALDLSEGLMAAAPPEETVLDLSETWPSEAEGTALLETPPSSPAAAAAEALSPNAQALAAFFAAEIDAQSPPAAPPAAAAPPANARPSAPPASPPPAAEDSFDASLSSIDWGGPAEVNLGAWSSAPLGYAEAPPPPPAASRAPLGGLSLEGAGLDTPPSAPPTAPRRAPETPPSAPPTNPAGSSSDRGSFLFDTGGSNFRFADDYVQRITKSFTGAVDEMILGKDASPSPSTLPRSSDDRAPAGGWSEADVQRIELLVRQEVQGVVREMVEKVAWEIIPELAENLIRKQLDQVLKQIDE